MLLRDLYTETAVGIACVVACEQILQHFANAFARAELLHLSVGVSKGFGLLLISLLLVCQSLAVVALLVPKIYLFIGAVAPSAILVISTWTDAWLFGDWSEKVVFWRCIILTASLTLIALFRFDRRARNLQLQVPTSSKLLTVEKYARTACTRLCTNMYCPVVSALLVWWSIFVNRFWKYHGLFYEFQRERWLFAMSLASLFAMQAALDTRRSKLWWLRAEAERRVQVLFPRHADIILGHGLGLKKHI